jgi:hypothetical protein
LAAYAAQLTAQHMLTRPAHGNHAVTGSNSVFLLR